MAIVVMRLFLHCGWNLLTLQSDNNNDTMEYNHREIEQRWQQYWRDNKIYRAEEKPGKKKFYVLDMFPYPSGRVFTWVIPSDI